MLLAEKRKIIDDSILELNNEIEQELKKVISIRDRILKNKSSIKEEQNENIFDIIEKIEDKKNQIINNVQDEITLKKQKEIDNNEINKNITLSDNKSDQVNSTFEFDANSDEDQDYFRDYNNKELETTNEKHTMVMYEEQNFASNAELNKKPVGDIFNVDEIEKIKNENIQKDLVDKNISENVKISRIEESENIISGVVKFNDGKEYSMILMNKEEINDMFNKRANKRINLTDKIVDKKQKKEMKQQLIRPPKGIIEKCRVLLRKIFNLFSKK